MFLSKHYDQQPKITNMKKIILFALMVFTISTYSQKKKHGTIYIDHPAINAVLSMNKAYFDGDIEKYASYLADDFREIDGLSSKKNQKGKTKEELLSEAIWLQENTSYASQTLAQGTYPIALEFKDGDDNDVVHVLASEHMKGVSNKTGVKIDTPINNLYIVNKENKIEKIIFYIDKSIVNELFDSYNEAEAGTFYNHHEYINKVRRLVYAFEFNDAETAYGFYSKKALFWNINMPAGINFSIEENKENDIKFREKFVINSIDKMINPICLDFDEDDTKLVLSRWSVKLTRKSDDKNIELPLRLFHYFNDKGLIFFTEINYSDKLLED